MSMTDPIADFLTRIRNGIRARKGEVSCPNSNLKLRIAEILKKEGYISAIGTQDDNKQGFIHVTLRWNHDFESAITGMRRVSTPGQRTYVRAKDVPKVHDGLGVAIVSTSHGVMTDRDARKLGVGGEVLCEVW